MILGKELPLLLPTSSLLLCPVSFFWLCFFLLYRKALEDLGIPCFLGGMSRGMLGKDSPIHIRQNRRDALKEADLVLLAGHTYDFIQ